MELMSQKMRELAPELDPLRIGTGWKPEDLSKPQIMIEARSETVIREAAIWIFWWKKSEKAWKRQADTARDILRRISVTERARERTALISVLPVGK